MQTLYWEKLSQAQRREALARPEAGQSTAVTEAITNIITQVRSGGDSALREFTMKFDGVGMDDFRVPEAEIDLALKQLPDAQRAAIERAMGNIERFHAAQGPSNIDMETESGLRCQRLTRPLDSVGLYVPGGTAPLVSTVMMLAIPAKLAGVKRRVLVSPPQNNGKINPAILAAAKLCGVTEVYAVGGAQAIAALAFGTKSIEPVAKIFGPGNKYVAAAKTYVSTLPGGPAIDLPAGPSEAMVVVDGSANPVFAVADLLSQAEHDVDAQVICVAADDTIAESVQDEIMRQVDSLPRAATARQSLQNGRLVIAGDTAEQLDIINAYAPEHLLLQCYNAEKMVSGIFNAGSIFIGPYTPESLGDYASGTNHTLPTGGAARAYSGVTLDAFMKYISVQSASRAALQAIGSTVETLAAMEGLEAHKRAVSLRLREMQS